MNIYISSILQQTAYHSQLWVVTQTDTLRTLRVETSRLYPHEKWFVSPDRGCTLCGCLGNRFLKLKITLVGWTYPGQRLQCPSLSPHFLLLKVILPFPHNLLKIFVFYRRASSYVTWLCPLLWLFSFNICDIFLSAEHQELCPVIVLPTPPEPTPGINYFVSMRVCKTLLVLIQLLPCCSFT